MFTHKKKYPHIRKKNLPKVCGFYQYKHLQHLKLRITVKLCLVFYRMNFHNCTLYKLLQITFRHIGIEGANAILQFPHL